jgi:hypothetical protein
MTGGEGDSPRTRFDIAVLNKTRSVSSWSERSTLSTPTIIVGGLVAIGGQVAEPTFEVKCDY